MERQEASRRAAQHALLDALRRFCPQPLGELRDGLPPLTPTVVENEPARTAERAARIRAAQQRVQALSTQTVEAPQVVDVDVETWAKRWHLQALLDLAPHLVAHWRRRPAAGARFYVPKVRPIPPSPRLNDQLDDHDVAQPLLTDADLESEDDFVARARAHYQAHAKELATRPHHRRRQIQRHAEWYVRAHVQRWTVNQIADDAFTGTDTIRKGIAEFARLLRPDVN